MISLVCGTHLSLSALAGGVDAYADSVNEGVHQILVYCSRPLTSLYPIERDPNRIMKKH